MTTPFKTGRSDGRSDGRVLAELVQDAPPETVFTYDDLQSALQAGLPSESLVSRARIYKAIKAANKILLDHHHRDLGVVVNVGYRILKPEEHAPTAMGRYRKGENQIKAGVLILRGADLNTMNPRDRQIHDGTMMIMSGIVSALQQSTRDIRRIDRIVDTVAHGQEDLAQRVARLEARQAGQGA
jgi:hypothetical protein